MKHLSVKNLLFVLSAVIGLLLATAYYHGSRWRRTIDELQMQGVRVEVVEPEWYQKLPSSFHKEWIRNFFRGKVVLIHYELCREFNDHIIQLTVDVGDIETLYLYYTGIDDESLRKIVSNNSSLSTILIFDTPVTCDSVRYLKKRYPGIRIGTSLECEP